MCATGTVRRAGDLPKRVVPLSTGTVCTRLRVTSPGAARVEPRDRWRTGGERHLAHEVVHARLASRLRGRTVSTSATVIPPAPGPAGPVALGGSRADHEPADQRQPNPQSEPVTSSSTPGRSGESRESAAGSVHVALVDSPATATAARNPTTIQGAAGMRLNTRAAHWSLPGNSAHYRQTKAPATRARLRRGRTRCPVQGLLEAVRRWRYGKSAPESSVHRGAGRHLKKPEHDARPRCHCGQSTSANPFPRARPNTMAATTPQHVRDDTALIAAGNGPVASPVTKIVDEEHAGVDPYLNASDSA